MTNLAEVLNIWRNAARSRRRIGMFEIDQYELVDFGRGRKLERFGPYVLDRPAPPSVGEERAQPRLWRTAAARYEREEKEPGAWLAPLPLPESWLIRHSPFTLELRPTPFGHLGVFPEQAENWDWLAKRISPGGPKIQVLNLFAYTGGSTLACAAAGAQVTHVDSSRTVVQWARRNADHSGLAAAPIRWIVEDATRFVRRELKRGRTYDAVVLDPPSYGHGARGEPWHIDQDLLPLLNACGQLTRGQSSFGVITCHTPSWGPDELRTAIVRAGLCSQAGIIDADAIWVTSRGGRRLNSGVVARWHVEPGC